MNNDIKLGANYLGDNKTEFYVFAPYCDQVYLNVIYQDTEKNFLLSDKKNGYHHNIIENVLPGNRYFYIINGKKYADPASQYQPEGIFGPSEVIHSEYKWGEKEKKWRGLPLSKYIIYEIHVGVYTAQGTFSEIISTLDSLCELGITALELMPIAQFSGARNWGYDGVFPFAPQNTYGTPNELKELVQACHQRGLAIILDVVYNHLGPEGNIFTNFAPYFTNRYRTPWGEAINFDGPHSDAVRYFFIQNAIMWVNDYHFDSLRLDALHCVFDYSAYSFLAELSDTIHKYAHHHNRHIFLFAESSLNDTKLIRAHNTGGYALDSQWNDEFHHAVHALLTNERNSYYQDFGDLSHLVKAYCEGYVLTGQYSKYRQCRHGHSSKNINAEKFVVFTQNHDQIGNRPNGERLSQLLSLNELKLAATLILLSPYIPLLFMGEEYGEKSPFLYFIDHNNPELINQVWKGRQNEILKSYPNISIKNPQNEENFYYSKINKSLILKNEEAKILDFYKTLIKIRKSNPVFYKLNKRHIKIYSNSKKKIMCLHRWHLQYTSFVFFNFSKNEEDFEITLRNDIYKKILDSNEIKWSGNGILAPESMDLKNDNKMRIRLQPKSTIIYMSQGNQ